MTSLPPLLGIATDVAIPSKSGKRANQSLPLAVSHDPTRLRGMPNRLLPPARRVKAPLRRDDGRRGGGWDKPSGDLKSFTLLKNEKTFVAVFLGYDTRPIFINSFRFNLFFVAKRR